MIFKPNYIDGVISITVQVLASSKWFAQVGSDANFIAQNILGQNSGLIHSFINGQVQDARDREFWAHTYQSPAFDIQFSKVSRQSRVAIIVRPENASPSGGVIYAGDIFVLDVPFTTYPLLGQQLRDTGTIVSWLGTGVIPQSDWNAKYAPPTDESNSFQYKATIGPYAYDPLFVDEAPSAKFKTNMSKGAPLAKLAVSAPYDGYVPMDTQGNAVLDLLTSGEGFPDGWGLKHVGASLICTTPMSGFVYFEVEIVNLPGGTPKNQTLTIPANKDASTYIKTDDADLTSNSLTLKFNGGITKYLSPVIGVVPRTFVDPTWKKPTVCYGRIIGLDQDPSEFRSIGCVPTGLAYANLQARYHFPGSYWMQNPSQYNSLQDDVITLVGEVWTYFPDGTISSYTSETFHDGNPHMYTGPWDAPSGVDNSITQINVALMKFDRNSALVNDNWLVTHPSASISGSGAIGVDGQYVIDSGKVAPNYGYADIPITGPGATAVATAAANGATAYNSAPTVISVYYSEDDLIHTRDTWTPRANLPLTPGVPYPFALDTYWPAGTQTPPSDPEFGATIWRYVGEVGGVFYEDMIYPSSKSTIPAFPNTERIIGPMVYIPQQFVTGAVDNITLLGNFFPAQGVTASMYIGTFGGFKAVTYQHQIPEIISTSAPGSPLGVNSFGGHTWVFKGRADQLYNATSPLADGSPGDGIWSGVDIGALGVGDIVMVAVDVKNDKIWFGKNNKWYDVSGVSQFAPGSKNLQPTMLLDKGTQYFPACSARWGHTQLKLRTGTALKYQPPAGFTAYNLVTIPTP